MKKLTFDTDNIGGLHVLYAIPPSAFTLGYDYGTRKYTLAVPDATDVVMIETFADGTYTFGESHGRDEHGDWWQPTIAGQIPKQSQANAEVMETLERGQWVVLSKDNNGVLRLAGDMDTPLTFSTEASTGALATDMNATSFTFTGKLGKPSPVIDTVTGI